MRRPNPISLLLAFELALFATLGSARDLGQLAQKIRIVTKTPNNQPAADMKVNDPVIVPMQVDTGKSSGAKFAIGSTQGAVIMGSKSRFRFRDGLFDATGLLLDKLDLEIEWGKFRFDFAPPLKGSRTVLGNHPGEVKIKTKSGYEISLYGTDVYLRAEKNGVTTLVVIEGSARVKKLDTQEVEGKLIEAGFWTTFGPNQRPIDPVPIQPNWASQPPWSVAPEIPDPALLDLRSPRLDLPKARRP
jgi:hypothetical protein